MKTTVAATVALAACAGTQLFAQNTKIDTLTAMTMTLESQKSVSTSATVANAGNFSQSPMYYTTQSASFGTKNLLAAMSYVIQNHNAAYYTSKASIELVQGEWSGFWNIDDGVAQSYPDYYYDQELTWTFNGDGSYTYNPYINLDTGGTGLEAVYFPDPTTPYDYYGYDSSGVYNFDDYIYNYVDDSAALTPSVDSSSGTPNEYVRLDTGRHFLPVPWANYTAPDGPGTPYPTTGEYPPGHMQPWGQIFIKDPGHPDSSGNPECDNVTFFFDLEVQECYDCFYLNSFISKATFKSVPGAQSGPPCCSSPTAITGNGVDTYYLTLDFDNTINNSFLNPTQYTNTDDDDDLAYNYNYVGYTGVQTPAAPADGLTPDLLNYSDAIKSHLGSPSPYETRFTLKGLLTYTWTLKFINPSSDVAEDFVGTARYAANGYGFIGLFCDLIPNASLTFTESIVKDVGCCDDQPWYGNWFGPGWDGGYGYFYPPNDQYNPYAWLNLVGGFQYDTLVPVAFAAPEYEFELPDQYESPYNPPAALTRHLVDYGSSSTANYNYDTYIEDDDYEFYYDYN